MLLKRCYIQGFGKLQEFTYEFTEGFNIICAENGWGKSTFAAFLRAMFYGLPQAGSRTKLEEAERRKYRPWNGGVMGGSLVFETNGKTYRAERTFGKKEAEDTFRLIDLSTNLESSDFSADLGKELFGLDKEAYSRSTYLPQNKITDVGMNDSIAKKLGKMAEGEEEDGSYDAAYEMLDELRKKYVPDRQKEEKGYVAELNRRFSEAQARLEACRRKEESAKPWREKEQEAAGCRKQAEAELVVCREKLEAAAGYEALAAKKHHYGELREREEELRVKTEGLQKLFPEGVPELSELRICRQEAQEAAVLAGEVRSYRLDAEEENRFSLYETRFGENAPELSEIQECIRQEAEIKEQLSETENRYQQSLGETKQKMESGNRMLLFGVILFLLAVVLEIAGLVVKREGKRGETVTGQTVVSEYNTEEQEIVVDETKLFVGKMLVGISGAVIGLGIVFILSGGRKRKEGLSKKQQALKLKKELSLLTEQGNRGRELLTQYGAEDSPDVTGGLYRLADMVREYQVLREKREHYVRSVGQKEELLAHCTGLLETYGMDTEDVTGSLHILENRTKDFLRFSEDYAEAVKKREQFEQETSPETFYGMAAPEVSFRELQSKEQELLVKIARLAEEEKDCRNRAEAFEEEAESCGELEELCGELAQETEQKKREHFFITETMKCLKTAKEQFSSRYLRGLTTGFERYLSILGEEDFSDSMDGHYGGIETDIDLNIRVNAYGEGKEPGYLSTGLRDLVGLCMRFALVDALFEKEAPPLVLDDPFVNLDKEKISRALSFLKDAGEQYQILYLVCHESRV